MTAVAYQGSGAETALSSHAFASATAARIAAAVGGGYRGCVLDVNSHQPPYPPGDEVPSGHLVLSLYAPAVSEVAIGIRWGLHEKGGGPKRSEFDPDAWLRDPTQPWWTHLVTASFDEAWRVVCLVAQALDAGAVSISHGA